MERRFFLPIAAATAVLFLISVPADAFQSTPNRTPNDTWLASMAGFQARMAHEASGRFLALFRSPCHEALTQAGYGCDKEELIDCAKKDHASAAMIWGARWNDDPPFRMTSGPSACRFDQTIRANTQPTCWYTLFKDAEQKAAAGETFGPGYAMLYRVHFGDLQFLHAMASQDGDPPGATRARIMMWAEFTWGLATETLSRTTRLKDLGVSELGVYFPGDISATILFSLGYPGFQNSKITEVALGSLLHMVQDSFSRSHVTRSDALGAECDGVPGALQPGAIRQFHSYAKQNHSAHNSADDAKALELNRVETTPSVVDVCAQIIRLWSRRASWTEARKYLDYVFALDPEALAAGPGEGYQQ